LHIRYNRLVRRNKSPEDLTIDELRRLLVEKRRRTRQEHLERFRRTGRVVTLTSDVDNGSLEYLHSDAEEGFQSTQFTPDIHRRGRRVLDGVLFAVEILAVLGLIFILYNGLGILRDLNQEVASALEQPTLTPTPLIVAVVLPSGHTPPDAPGGTRPNEAEIPEHLRPLVQSLAEVPIPTLGPEQAIRIQVPTISVDAPIVQGDGWEQLKKGVGQHIGSANPGQKGNLVLTAHNDVFGEIFRHLDELNKGDQVIIYTNQRAYTYIVSASEIVEPTQVEVMAPTPQETITLISCYPYRVDNKRIVVKGMLQNSNQ
jgi:sortase A